MKSILNKEAVGNENQSISYNPSSSHLGSTKLLLKRFGSKFGSPVSQYYRIHSITSIIYVFFVLLASSTAINSNLIGFWKTFSTLFSVYADYSDQDIQYRFSIDMYMDRFYLMNNLLYTEAIVRNLNAGNITIRLATANMMVDSIQTQLGTDDIYLYIVDEMTTQRENLDNSIKRLMTNENFKDVPSDLLDRLLKYRFEMNNYYGITSTTITSAEVSDNTFVSNLNVALGIFEANLRVLRPFLQNKRPPYNVPSGVLSDEYITPIPARFSALRNSLSGILDFHNETLHEIKRIGMIEEPVKRKSRTLYYFLALIILVSAFISASLYLARLVNRHLFDLFSQYRNLRKEEVVINNSILRFRVRFIRRYNLDEKTMVRSYMKTNLGSDQMDVALKLQTKTESGKGNLASRAVRFQFNFNFSTAKITVFFSCLSLALVCYLLLMNINQMNSFDRTQKMMIFYSESFDKIIGASNHYLYHLVFLIFGNYIRINEERPNELFARTITSDQKLSDLKSYLISQRTNFLDFFGNDRGKELDDFLFKSVCGEIRKTRPRYEEDLRVCLKNQHARLGMIAYLEDMSNRLRNMRSMLRNDTDFLNFSRSRYDLYPYQDYMYRDEELNFRMTNKIVFETVFSILLPVGRSVMDADLSSLYSRIVNNNWIIFVSMVIVYVSIYLYILLSKMKYETLVCAETLRNIVPEVISQNKLIYKALSETYLASSH